MTKTKTNTTAAANLERLRKEHEAAAAGLAAAKSKAETLRNKWLDAAAAHEKGQGYVSALDVAKADDARSKAAAAHAAAERAAPVARAKYAATLARHVAAEIESGAAALTMQPALDAAAQAIAPILATLEEERAACARRHRAISDTLLNADTGGYMEIHRSGAAYGFDGLEDYKEPLPVWTDDGKVIRTADGQEIARGPINHVNLINRALRINNPPKPHAEAVAAEPDANNDDFPRYDVNDVREMTARQERERRLARATKEVVAERLGYIV